MTDFPSCEEVSSFSQSEPLMFQIMPVVSCSPTMHCHEVPGLVFLLTYLYTLRGTLLLGPIPNYLVSAGQALCPQPPLKGLQPGGPPLNLLHFINSFAEGGASLDTTLQVLMHSQSPTVRVVSTQKQSVRNQRLCRMRWFIL